MRPGYSLRQSASPESSRSSPLFVYKGAVVNQTTQESIPVLAVFTIMESGVTVTTTAKTFTNCIKILSNQITGDDIEETIQYWCQGRGEVKTLQSEGEQDDRSGATRQRHNNQQRLESVRGLQSALLMPTTAGGSWVTNAPTICFLHGEGRRSCADVDLHRSLRSSASTAKETSRGFREMHAFSRKTGSHLTDYRYNCRA